MRHGAARILATVGMAVALSVATLTGVAGATTPKPPAADPGVFPGYAKTLAKYAAQPVDWAECYDDGSNPLYECADITVPMDWHHPELGSIGIDITRARATGPHRRGILLTNPGGPGALGYWVPEYFQAVEPDLNAVYDIIAMDPRGTWVTTLDCAAPDALDPANTVDLQDLRPKTVSLVVKTVSDYAKQCGQYPLTKYITTDQTARDLDLVRALLGASKASYVGYSAGTWLGTWYATLFPSRVDRFVIDGNVDTVVSWDVGGLSQPGAFQHSFEAGLIPWLAANDATYHLGATPRAVKRTYDRRRAALGVHPLTLPDGSPLTSEFYDTGISGALYATSLYPEIAEAMAAVEHWATATPDEQDLAASWFTPLFATDPESNVFAATICQDTKNFTVAQQFATGIPLQLKYPLVGQGWYANFCAFWKVPPTGSPVTGKGLPPMLMLQNDQDPATPLSGALHAHAANPTSRLVLVKHQIDHTIYGSGDECVETIANAYLISGVFPNRDRTCPGLPLPEVAADASALRAQSAAPAAMSPDAWRRRHPDTPHPSR
jgi:pimeloyl-ACP methyl ester carboxylesterase